MLVPRTLPGRAKVAVLPAQAAESRPVGINPASPGRVAAPWLIRFPAMRRPRMKPRVKRAPYRPVTPSVVVPQERGARTGGGSKKSLGGQPDVFQRRAEDYSSREAQAIRARVGRVAIGVTVAVVVVVIVATVATMTWFVAAPKAVVKPSAMQGLLPYRSPDGGLLHQRLPNSDGHAEQLHRCDCKPVREVRAFRNLLVAAKMDPKEWMSIKNPESLFLLVVRKIVDTGVMSVLNITKKDSKTVIVEVGTCISCSADGDGSFVKFLLDKAVATKVVDSASVKRLSQHLLNLDKSLQRVPPAPRGAAVVNADSNVFRKADKKAWTNALSGSRAGFTSNWVDLRILSSNSKGVGQVVDAISQVLLEVANLYTLLVPVAPYMAVERWEAGRRASMKTFTAKTKCLNNMGFLFPAPFDTAVANFLGAQKAAVTFSNLWSSVRLAGVSALHLGKGLDLDKNALLAASIGVGETSGLNDPAFVENYDDDFMANLVRYVRLGRRKFRAAEFRSNTPPKGGFLPTNYFLPDYYYKEATETTLNSGTLGVLAASMMFRMSSMRLPSEPTPYIKCLTSYSRNSLKLVLNEADWLTYTRSRWSVQVALAATRQESDKRHRRELDAIHYLRFARGYCGEEERDRMPLKFTARTSANFNETFECNYPYPLMEVLTA
ncbi:hypothetical protein MRX96_024250 [Rhipicephalus microplus]